MARDDLWHDVLNWQRRYQVRNGGSGFPLQQPFYLGGWVCAGCHRGYSPAVLVCEHCGPGNESAGPAVHLGSTSGPGPEHDLCAPLSEGGLCDHDEDEQRCTGGRYCSC